MRCGREWTSSCCSDCGRQSSPVSVESGCLIAEDLGEDLGEDEESERDWAWKATGR